MTKVNKLTLGVFKPEDLDSISFVKEMSELKGVDSVSIKILNDFRGVEETRLDVIGSDLNLDRIKKELIRLKSSLSSVDGVTCGELAF